MKHHLITISIAANAHMHAYLMAPDDERYVADAMDRLFDEAEKAGFHPFQLVLATQLNRDGREMVRAIITKLNDEARQLLASATDYHLSIWQMRDDHPDDAPLMKLH